jgi:hypothetical protein
MYNEEKHQTRFQNEKKSITYYTSLYYIYIQVVTV